MAVAICEADLEAGTMDDSRDRVAADGGELVVAGNEGEILENNDVGEEGDDDCACSTLPGDYPYAAYHIS